MTKKQLRALGKIAIAEGVRTSEHSHQYQVENREVWLHPTKGWRTRRT